MGYSKTTLENADPKVGNRALGVHVKFPGAGRIMAALF